MERLTLHSVKLSDAGWYTCVVNNIYGQIQQSAWIAVLKEESFISPSDSYLFVAVTVSLSVFAASVIIIAICWQWQRPPKSRPLVLRENSMYFQSLNLPIDPQWEINRNQ